MMRQYELVERVKEYDPGADEDLLNRAYVYAMRAHGAQTRASGDPYFSHPLEVAAILTDLKLDDATIAAAVLHDVIEDTAATREEIDRLFGPEIGALVEGLTKIRRLDLVSKKAAQAENLRKLLLAVAQDVRVLLVKLADRLHNMRTLHFVPPEKRARVAQETLDIYAPLAGRMGIQWMRDELEELAFRSLSPEAHAALTARLKELRARSGDVIRAVEAALAERLREAGIEASVGGREKSAYSVWRKMERKQLAFEQLSDIYGFRVVVGGVPECYRALGVVHTTWPVVPGRFKDYVSTPKGNDYQSLHTTVIGPRRQRAELQIRTSAMEAVAEYGIAAHPQYKDGLYTNGRAPAEGGAYQWLRRTIGLLAEGDSPEEFLEHTKLELFHDQVFCFTPKGQLIPLPRGATPVDFAYAVHTSVGDEAVAARVNGLPVPLFSELANGDEVEIVRAAGGVPPAAWEGLVATGKARAAVRRATRAAVRRQYAGLGRHIVERAFERLGKPFDEARLKAALPRLARASLEDAFAAVGRGEALSADVVRAVHPELREPAPGPGAPAPPEAEGWFPLTGGDARGMDLRFRVPAGGGSAGEVDALPIRGLDAAMPVRFAPEAGAVPGDRIVGILTPGGGVTIYPIQSPGLSAFDDQPERWLDVRWAPDAARGHRYPARLKVSAVNEPGTLATVAGAISGDGGNIDAVTMVSRSPDYREMLFDVEVRDLAHLGEILADLRARPVVSEAERVVG